MKVTGVLLETTAIQSYVFGSKKLKENLAASYLISNVYDGLLTDIADEMFGANKELCLWREAPEEINITREDIYMEVGYIGGGDALLLVKDPEKAIPFVQQWTKKLLLEAPGLSTAVAVGEVDTEDSQTDISDLFEQINENKFTYHPQAYLLRHGITTECPRTGLSAECLALDGKYISCVAASKLKHEEDAHNMFSQIFETVLNGHSFPKVLDSLGQSTGESHIAIVHIDGNGMGQRFIACEDIPSLRKLSDTVHDATETAMKELVEEIVRDHKYYREVMGLELKNRELPIRPIILGGDDVTFVCDARLGIYFAEIFMKAFSNKHVNDRKQLSSCAGVAITKTKYPFYRGYELAEQLCKSAKGKAKDDQSWLDYHIAYSGFSGNPSVIRQRHFTVREGALCLRPYCVTPELKGPRNFHQFKVGAKCLSDRWPRNKQMELRNTLTLGKNATKEFIIEQKYRGYELPEIQEHPAFRDEGWENGETPYFDMLELAEFYPMDKIGVGL